MFLLSSLAVVICEQYENCFHKTNPLELELPVDFRRTVRKNVHQILFRLTQMKKPQSSRDMRIDQIGKADYGKDHAQLQCLRSNVGSHPRQVY